MAYLPKFSNEEFEEFEKEVTERNPKFEFCYYLEEPFTKDCLNDEEAQEFIDSCALKINNFFAENNLPLIEKPNNFEIIKAYICNENGVYTDSIEAYIEAMDRDKQIMIDNFNDRYKDRRFKSILAPDFLHHHMKKWFLELFEGGGILECDSDYKYDSWHDTSPMESLLGYLKVASDLALFRNDHE